MQASPSVTKAYLIVGCPQQLSFSACLGPRGVRAKLEAEVPAFNIRMGRELGAQMMLILLVALAYAAVSPLILPFALWWFAASWLMWRYSILYVFERCYESGGVVCVRLNLIFCPSLHQADPVALLMPDAVWAAAIGPSSRACPFSCRRRLWALYTVLPVHWHESPHTDAHEAHP